MSDERRVNDEQLVRLSALERVRLLIDGGRAVAVLGMIVTFLVAGLQYVYFGHQEEKISISAADYQAVVETLADARSHFASAVQIMPPDPKAALELKAGIDRLQSAENLLRQSAANRKDASLVLFTPAYAEDQPNALPDQNFNKPMILYAILIAMAALLVIFFLIYLFSKDADRIKFAQSNLQTLISFMIGVAAGMLGTSGSK